MYFYGVKHLHNLVTVLIIALFLCETSISAQQIIVNQQGEKILMFDDGSWRPATEGDSIYLKKPSPQLDPEKSQIPVSVTDQWKKLSQEILNQDKRIQTQFREATNRQFKTGQALNSAKRQKSTDKGQLNSLEASHAESIKQLKTLKESQVEIRKLIQKMRKWAYPTSNIDDALYNKLLGTYNKYLTKYKQPEAPFEELLGEKVKTNVDKKEKADEQQRSEPSKKIKKDRIKIDESDFPEEQKPHLTSFDNSSNFHSSGVPWATKAEQSSPCVIELDSLDQMTGLRKRALPFAPIFFHTDPDLRPFFKNKDLITCRGKLASIGDQFFIQVEYEIASANSQNNFGGLAQGSLLRLKLLSGELISVYNTKADLGKINSYSGNTIFTGTYPLSRDDIKKLSETELDKMRVMWNTGFEDYEIIYLDFFKQQLACLMSVRS